MQNSVLAQEIAAVMAAGSPSQYLIDLHFISKSNTTLNYRPLILDSLFIKQDFANDYADNITASFKIASADYATLNDNAQDLMAILTITALDSKSNVVFTPAPQQYTYRAVIVNPKDIRRQLSDVASRTVEDTNITIRLVDQVVYDLRHQQINGIYQATTLNDAISHIAQTFNFKTLHLVTPDNTHSYDHITIPPGKGFSEIFGHLHDNYGVYMKGMNHYTTGGTLHVYPPHETAPVHPQTCILYQADDGAYSGASSFHKTTGQVTEIVVNRESKSQDVTQAAGENKGTAAMFLRSSVLVDGIVTVDPKNGAQFNPNLAASLRLTTPTLATPGAQNSSYKKASDNIFKMASGIAAGQATMMEVDWAHAVPLLLLPGCALKYNYDKNGSMITQTGILEGAQYSLNRGSRISAGMMYLVSGKLILRLQPTTNASTS